MRERAGTDLRLSPPVRNLATLPRSSSIAARLSTLPRLWPVSRPGFDEDCADEHGWNRQHAYESHVRDDDHDRGAGADPRKPANESSGAHDQPRRGCHCDCGGEKTGGAERGVANFGRYPASRPAGTNHRSTRFVRKPSAGLEPATPSLPWRFRGVDGVVRRCVASRKVACQNENPAPDHNAVRRLSTGTVHISVTCRAEILTELIARSITRKTRWAHLGTDTPANRDFYGPRSAPGSAPRERVREAKKHQASLLEIANSEAGEVKIELRRTPEVLEFGRTGDDAIVP